MSTYLIQTRSGFSENNLGTLWFLETAGSLSPTNYKLFICAPGENKYEQSGEKFVNELLTCCEKLLTELHFHLLVSVSKLETRLKLYGDRSLLDWAAGLQVGQPVNVLAGPNHAKTVASGVIRFVGKLEQDVAGRMFGIELQSEFIDNGCTDGVFRKVQYFKCGGEWAVFVNIASLVRPTAPSPAPMLTSASNVSRGSRLRPVEDEDYAGGLSHQPSWSSPVFADSGIPPAMALPHDGNPLAQSVVRECQLSPGERIVWMSDSGPEFGEVKWIGFLPDHVGPFTRDRLTVGVDFVNEIGSGTGRYKSYKLFSVRHNHASLVPIMGLMKATDWGVEPELTPAVDGLSLSNFERASISSPYRASNGALNWSDETSSRISISSSGAQFSPQPDVNNSSFSLLENAMTDSVRQLPAAASFPTNVRQRDPDSFSSVSSSYEKRLPSMPSSLQHKGRVLPPSIADVEWLCGVNRGIQRTDAYASCALESIVLTLFSFNSDFDKYLFSSNATEPGIVTGVRQILVEHIVNPIRRTPYVSGDRVRRFGELLQMIPVDNAASGAAATEKPKWMDNPSVLVYHILRNLVGSPKLFSTKSDINLSEGGYIYTVDDINTPNPFPSLQNLMECAVVSDPSRRLVNLPSSLFIVSVNTNMPTMSVSSSKKFPALVLDVAGLLDNIKIDCRLCGADTSVEGGIQCGECFMAESSRKLTDVFQLVHFTYCSGCFESHSKKSDRLNHVGYRLNSMLQPQSMIVTPDSRTKMDLYAVISIINKHFVVFFKAGCGLSAEWLMYDAMSARSQDNDTSFVPEIRRCPEIAEWLANVQRARLADKLPDIINHLTMGLRLCFYRPQIPGAQ